MPKCPTCGKPFELDATSTPPFCSPRCRQIDLGRWLDERYGLPVESDDEPDDQAGENPLKQDDEHA